MKYGMLPPSNNDMLRLAKARIEVAASGQRTRAIHLMMFKLAHTDVARMDPLEVIARLGVQASYATEWQKMVNLAHDITFRELTP